MNVNSSCVYLIEAENGLIKIGTGNPVSRLRTVRTHSPVLVRLAAQWPGQLADEQALHRKFLHFRTHLEWFRNEGALAVFFAENLGRGLQSIEHWDALRFASSEGRRAESRKRQKVAMRGLWHDPKWKLHQLGQMLAGKMERAEFGLLPYSEMTNVHHRRSDEIRAEAHRIVRASVEGLRLLSQIEATAENGRSL